MEKLNNKKVKKKLSKYCLVSQESSKLINGKSELIY